MRRLGAAALARIATLPVSLGCGLLTAHLLIEALGPGGYGLVSLILMVQIFYYFLDLGTGAAVLNGAAEHRHTRDRAALEVPLYRAMVVTALTCSTFLGASLVVSLAGGWPSILGRPGASGLDWALTYVLALNVISRPLSLMGTALIGLGHQVLVIALQGMVPLVTLAWVGLGVRMDAPIAYFGCGLVAGQVCFGAVAATLFVRRVGGLSIDDVHDARMKARQSGWRIRDQAAPMTVINLAASAGTGFDRLILSHQSSPSALAAYALASQLVQPMLSVAQAGHQAFWSEVATLRAASNPTLRRTVMKVTGIVLMAGALALVTLIFALGPVASIVSSGEIATPVSLAVAFGVVVWAQLALIGPGGALTTAWGLRAQAGVLLFATLVNLTLSIALTQRFGATGPALGSAVGGVLTLLGVWAIWLVKGSRFEREAAHGVRR